MSREDIGSIRSVKGSGGPARVVDMEVSSNIHIWMRREKGAQGIDPVSALAHPCILRRQTWKLPVHLQGQINERGKHYDVLAFWLSFWHERDV